MRKYLIPLLLLCAIRVHGQSLQCIPTQILSSGAWASCQLISQPNFAQAPVAAKSSGSVASINAAYGSNTTKGSTLIVVFANGNNNNPAAPITDTLSLTWFKAVQVANGSAFETEIWYAPNTVGGADTVTVTPGGSNASIAMAIYEVAGLVFPALNSSPTGGQAIDQNTSNTGTGGTSPAVSITPIISNEYVFVGFGLGTAAQTITVTAPYNNDSGQQNPTTPAGLFSFVSASLYKSEMVTSSPSATATSEPWAVAVASFKPISLQIQGTFQGLGTAGTPAGGVVSIQGVGSGTAVPISAASLPLPSGASTSAKQPALGTAGSASTDVITVQGIASMTKLLVTPDSVALPANQSVNESQISGVTPLMNNGVSGTGSQRINVASDNLAIGNWGHGATGSAVPANATAEGLKDTSGNLQDALADTNGRQFFKSYPDTTTTSYHASSSFAGSSTTDNAVMPGNATNTVLLNKVTVTCTQTTAGIVTLTLIKRSAADTSGTSATMTKVPDDANYAAAVSAPLTYTGTGPSVGAAVGNLDVAQFGCNASATAGPNDIYIFKPMKPIILRGTAQQVAVNMGNAAITGGTLSVTFDWEETTTP